MKPKILIVEDDVATTKLLQFILESEGFHAEVAFSGVEGLEKMADFAPQLVLLDVMMPGMDGFEVCRKLKEAPETFRLPIVFISAKAAPEDVDKGLSLGADDYIIKPFIAQDLVARLRQVLERYPRHQTIQPLETRDWNDSLKVISLGMDSFTKWDLVKFFYERPESFFTLEDLVEALRRSPEQLQRDLSSLAAAGFCRTKGPGAQEYQFTNDVNLRQGVEEFLRYCKNEQGRIKAVCQILKHETGLLR